MDFTYTLNSLANSKVSTGSFKTPFALIGSYIALKLNSYCPLYDFDLGVLDKTTGI